VCTAILLGIDVKDRRDYSREPANFELPTELRKQLKLKCSALTVIKDCGCGAVTKKHASMDSAKPGDVVLFRFVNQPQHVGILTDRGVIHAFQPRMKVVEHTLDQKWSKRIVEIYEFPGVTD
jgi:cell wall-associated NlpC family hydrolase